MSKVTMEVTQDDIDSAGQDGGDFVLAPPGYYTMKLKECNSGFSKTDGTEDKKRPRLECIWEFVGVGKDDLPLDANYGQVWDYVSFSEASGWKRAEFMAAVGVSVKAGKATSFDTDEVVGTKVLAAIKNETGQDGGDKRAKVRKLFPWSEENVSAAAEVDYSGEAENAGDTDSGDELLTEESLGAYGVKDLGAIAQEFDLDPDDYVVRGKDKKVNVAKTKAAVISAILEAQNGADDGDEDDEDSPF